MKRLIPLLVVAAALGAPSAALAGGVVVKVQRATHLVAVANTNKHVSLVHSGAAARLHVGQRVSFHARALRNGTFAASSMKVVGRVRTVKIRGLLLAKSSTRLVLSAGGAVIALNRGRTTASARDGGPTPGSTVDATATVGKDGELEDDNVTTVSPSAPGGQIDGQLTIGSGTITVTSEHMSLVINVPAGMDLSTFTNGQEVLAVFSQQADGTLLLTTLSGNQDAEQADSQQSSEDGNSNNNGSGDSGGGSGGSGGGSGDGGGDGGSSGGGDG